MKDIKQMSWLFLMAIALVSIPFMIYQNHLESEEEDRLKLNQLVFHRYFDNQFEKRFDTDRTFGFGRDIETQCLLEADDIKIVGLFDDKDDYNFNINDTRYKINTAKYTPCYDNEINNWINTKFNEPLSLDQIHNLFYFNFSDKAVNQNPLFIEQVRQVKEDGKVTPLEFIALTKSYKELSKQVKYDDFFKTNKVN